MSFRQSAQSQSMVVSGVGMGLGLGYLFDDNSL